MNFSFTFLMVYAILLFVGGFLGFKAGSKISLIMGLISSVIIAGGLYLINQGNVKQGYEVVAVMAVVLCISFGSRFVKTKKMMPSGMLLILSLIAAAVALKSIF